MMQGDISEDIAKGIDELMIRQPVGVCGAIVPFNFPGMIAFWFLPYAIACGNPFIVKPSEKVPLSMQKIFQLIDEQIKLFFVDFDTSLLEDLFDIIVGGRFLS